MFQHVKSQIKYFVSYLLHRRVDAIRHVCYMIISKFGIKGYPILEFVTNFTKFISELQRASMDLSDIVLLQH